MNNESSRSEGLRFVVFNTEEILRVLPVPAAGVVTIGRGEGNTVEVTDGAVSRRHVKITISSEPAGPRLTVEDLASRNGTQVNDGTIPPASPTTFQVGELVIVGSTALVVVRGDPPPAPELFADLRRAFERREEEAELYRRFAPRVRLFGLRHLRNEAAAQDLVQEAFVVTLERLSSCL